MRHNGVGLEGLERLGLDKRLLGISYAYPVVTVVCLMCQLRASRARQRGKADNKKNRKDRGGGSQVPGRLSASHIHYSAPSTLLLLLKSPLSFFAMVVLSGLLKLRSGGLWGLFLVSHFTFFCSVVKFVGSEPVTLAHTKYLVSVLFVRFLWKHDRPNQSCDSFKKEWI